MDVHLCVLIHGLWGDTSHMLALQESLRSLYPHQSLQFLITKSNAKAKTYDGICIGGERAAHEIEHYIRDLSYNGLHTRRISIVGYSMGGLIARYAIGVLFQNRLFDSVQPANFTTFATPHLGANVKAFGELGSIIDKFISQRLSVTGQQLFLVDDHLDSGKPLLYLLAERDSIYHQGLSRFQRFAAYGNITGDYCVPYTTATFDMDDPWAELLPRCGQKDIIKHPSDAIVKDVSENSSREGSALPSCSSHIIRQGAAYTALGLVSLICMPPVLAYSTYQTILSKRRIKQHRDGRTEIDTGRYCIGNATSTTTIGTHYPFKAIRPARGPPVQVACLLPTPPPTPPGSPNASNVDLSLPQSDTTSDEGKSDEASLVPMISAIPSLLHMKVEIARNLDRLPFDKFPVHIQQTRHAHAAIIARAPKKRFAEGRDVCEHWAQQFVI
ncbi:hypothetical protein NU219Hw_g2160t1 [Hortaea werneckii]